MTTVRPFDSNQCDDEHIYIEPLNADSTYEKEPEKSDQNVVENPNQEEPVHMSWQLEKSFQSRAELDAFLKTEDCWSLRSKQQLKKGTKIVYRCNKVFSKGEPCAQQIYVLETLELPPDSDSEPDTERPTSEWKLFRNN